MQLKLNIVGVAKARQNVSSIKAGVANRKIRQALSRATGYLPGMVRRSIYANWPSTTGALRASIIRKNRWYARTKTAVAIIGARSSVSRPRITERNHPLTSVPYKYFSLYEKGVKAHSITQSGGPRHPTLFTWIHPGFKGRRPLGDVYGSQRATIKTLFSSELSRIWV